MAFRTAGLFAIKTTNVAQPLFGSWVTAVSPAAGFAKAASAPLVLTLGTAQSAGNDASQIFTAGEEAWLVDPSGSNPGGVNGEAVRIASILNNTVTLGPKTTTVSSGLAYPFTENPHVAGVVGTGSYLIPKQMLNNFLVQYEDASTGPFLYLGNRQGMTAILYRFYKMAAVASGIQPYFFTASMTSPGNPYDLSEVYVYGTAGDLYNVSLNVD